MHTTFVIALVGAESTGKTSLATALAAALAAPEPGDKRRVAVVPEYLREFCDHHGRTPQRNEQTRIAEEQARRIEAAAEHADIVVADTTALMTAVYSEQVFGDSSLYASALRSHSRCNLTLLTAIDLPWQPDGLQRDGTHVREPVDAALRGALNRSGVPYSVVFGHGESRVSQALASVRRGIHAPSVDRPATARWQWHCDRCSDPDCERRSLWPRSE